MRTSLNYIGLNMPARTVSAHLANQDPSCCLRLNKMSNRALCCSECWLDIRELVSQLLLAQKEMNVLQIQMPDLIILNFETNSSDPHDAL